MNIEISNIYTFTERAKIIWQSHGSHVHWDSLYIYIYIYIIYIYTTDQNFGPHFFNLNLTKRMYKFSCL